MDSKQTFEDIWNSLVDSSMLDEENNSLIWKKTIARFFWEEQQRKIVVLRKQKKLIIEALAWMADMPSDDTLVSMQKDTIIELFKLNTAKATAILSKI